MKSTTRYALSVILLSSVVASTYHTGTKLRRDGVLNLYPFPRVGRAGSRSWQSNDMLFNTAPIKRHMYAFPRVGRSDKPHPVYQLLAQLKELLFGKRNTTAMWFGPRLGRSFPSENDDIFQSTEKKEPEQLDNMNMDREKRQTKHT